jgi:type I restriction enzyme R subunit
VKHGPGSVELFFGTPTPGNVKAEELFAANVFSVAPGDFYLPAFEVV